MKARIDKSVFADAAAATAFAEAIRWPGGIACPNCRETRRIAAHDTPGAHLCQTCLRPFSVASGTLMARSAVGLPDWLRALDQLAQDRPGGLVATLEHMFGPSGNDPDLRLLADGHAVRPFAVESLAYSFALPACPSELRILSRHVVPAELDPAVHDLRKLGVSICAISLESGSATLDIPFDHPALVDGFYRPETGHRWTDGRALLPAHFLAGLEGALVVRIRVSGTQMIYSRRF